MCPCLPLQRRTGFYGATLSTQAVVPRLPCRTHISSTARYQLLQAVSTACWHALPLRPQPLPSVASELSGSRGLTFSGFMTSCFFGTFALFPLRTEGRATEAMASGPRSHPSSLPRAMEVSLLFEIIVSGEGLTGRREERQDRVEMGFGGVRLTRPPSLVHARQAGIVGCDCPFLGRAVASGGKGKAVARVRRLF